MEDASIKSRPEKKVLKGNNVQKKLENEIKEAKLKIDI